MSHEMFKIEEAISPDEALAMHPISLAFIGDSVQSLYCRAKVSIGSASKTGVLHKMVTNYVKAVSQAKTIDRIFDTLTDAEHDIFRRARNCRVQTSAKHAELAEYRKASGFEAILGYLYLIGDTERLRYMLVESMVDAQENVAKQTEDTTLYN